MLLSLLLSSVLTLTVPQTDKQIVEGQLDMGMTLSNGQSIEVNNYYMSIDGKPVIPVMGEFHFSRYPREQWEEEIVKMQAGGVNLLPTYVFWALHEPREGEFHWEGNLDLRYFLSLCKKHQMNVIIRIGAFCHGEMRQGSIPEWIFAKPMQVRSNDPMYLEYVDKLYAEIAKQLQGMYYQDGGPIIGCQLENEMQHSASPWGICYPGEVNDYTASELDADGASIGVAAGHQISNIAEMGNEHMRTLYRIAQKYGIVTPFYTATGWGNAAVLDNKAIPVTSAYTYPFWEAVPKPSPFMLFKDIHANPDYAPVRYNPTDFPSFCAEMGAGIQIIYSSRPVVTAEAAEALMVRTLGSGCNGIGYYMYHGGSTPRREGQNAFSSDEPMGLPKISYDFQAPLGEFGLEGRMYRNLRLIHSFLNLYEDRLAPMQTVLPEGYDRITPDNTEDVRWAVRSKGNSGFIFMVNFQDHQYNRHDQSGTLELNLSQSSIINHQSTIKIPFLLPKDESLILPFNLDMDGQTLTYATAQPLMRLMEGKTPHYIFFAPAGTQPEFVFGNKTYRPQPGYKSTFTHKGVRITCLTKQQALDAVQVNGRLLITDATVLPDATGAQLLSMGQPNVEYTTLRNGKFVTQTASVDSVQPDFQFDRRTYRRGSLHFIEPDNTPQVHEYFLKISYTADVVMAFMGGQLCQDVFWQGFPWEIGLKRYHEQLKTEDMTFYFRPLKDMPMLHRDLPAEVLPDFSNGPVLDIQRVEIIPQYKMHVTL